MRPGTKRKLKFAAIAGAAALGIGAATGVIPARKFVYPAVGATAAGLAARSMAKNKRPDTRKKITYGAAAVGAIFPTAGLLTGIGRAGYVGYKKMKPEQKRNLKELARQHTERAAQTLKRFRK